MSCTFEWFEENYMMGMHTKVTTRDSIALQDKQLWEVLTTPGLKRPGEGIVLRPKDKDRATCVRGEDHFKETQPDLGTISRSGQEEQMPLLSPSFPVIC